MTEKKTVKVKVQSPFRVVHDTKEYVEGQTLTVPESVAAEWEDSGYVERVSARKK